MLEAGTTAALLSHTPWQLCSERKKLVELGSKTNQEDGATPKEATGKNRCWILLWHQFTSVCPRPRCRAAPSQFASTGSWHAGCGEYTGDIFSFWHLSYLPDKHSWPQQRAIGCFWHRLLIPCIQCRLLRQVYFNVLLQVTHTHDLTFGETLGPVSAPLLLRCAAFTSMALVEMCSLCTVVPHPPYCPPSPCYKVPSRTSSDSKSGRPGPAPGTETWYLSQTLRPEESCPTLFKGCFYLLSSERLKELSSSRFIFFFYINPVSCSNEKPQYFKTSNMFSRRQLTHSSFYT